MESNLGGQKEDEEEQEKGLCQVRRTEQELGGQVCDRRQRLVSRQVLLVLVQALWLGSIWP